MDEDCLYLSIWVPENLETRLSVLVWLTAGRGQEDGGGEELSAQGNLVVVKVESRRGALGFLATQGRSVAGKEGSEQALWFLATLGRSVAGKEKSKQALWFLVAQGRRRIRTSSRVPGTKGRSVAGKEGAERALGFLYTQGRFVPGKKVTEPALEFGYSG